MNADGKSIVKKKDIDPVDRKEAIDAVTDELDMIDHVPQWVYDRLENRIKQLPPVTPKQHTGHWIHVSEEMWKCDQCGGISCCSPNFCPDCGSYNGRKDELPKWEGDANA